MVALVQVQSSRGPLVGRQSEVEAVLALLGSDDVRLLTLTGPGGVGKTRLASAVIEAGDDGEPACFVDLTTIGDPSLVLPAVASALEVREAAGQTHLQVMRAQLAGTGRLVVLDNFEHVLAAASDVAALLGALPGLKVLATSREPLGLLLEQEYPLAPLALPAPEDLAGDGDRLAEVPAMTLLLRRARAVRPDFAITPANARALAEVVTRLDGIPLAIELAAARLHVLTPQALLGRLDEWLDLLQSRERDRPERHRSLRAALSWSYDLLYDDERRLFRNLGVFAAPTTLDAIESISTPEGQRVGPSTLALVESLVEKGLLARQEGSFAHGGDGEPSFRLLETLRVFALEQLRDSGELPEARTRHAAYYAGLAERAEAELNGPNQLPWFARLRHEWGNFEAALAWTVEQGDASLAVRLASITSYWWRRGQMAEGRRWLSMVVPLIEASTDPAIAAAGLRILVSAGFLSGLAGDFDTAEDSLLRGAAFAMQAGVPGVAAQAHGFRAWLAWIDGRDAWLDEADHALDEVLPGADPWSAGFSTTIMGVALAVAGQPERAHARLEVGLPLLQSVSESVGVSVSLIGYALVARDLGDLEGATDFARRSLAELRKTADVQALLTVVETVVILASERAVVAPSLESASRRARLIGALERFRETVGMPRARAWRPGWERLVEACRSQLGVEAYMDAFGAAALLSPPEIVEEAAMHLEECAAPPATEAADLTADAPALPPVGPASTGLTSRELEVAILIARGRTSRQIADALVISERTADTHAAHIREKLSLRSRAEIAAWVTRQGLVESLDAPAD